MPHDESKIPPQDDRDARMRRAVADFVREVVLGRDVTPEAWAEGHPELLPELRIELKKAQLIGFAYRRALEDGSPTAVDLDEQPTVSYWRTDVSSLHVRCPHCHNPVDISGDASLVDILCTTCGSSFSLLCDTQATPTLKRIGHFELVERLGIGGFGTVWKARDTELDRTVAIKIPRAGRLGTPDVEVSFFREARAAAQLKHPGIVSVHEVGRQDDTIYIVSDLVRGVSLSEWLTAAKPTAREAAELCAKIADALHHAHEAGVVHRDLKPSNIMVDLDGEPHIMDFGLARRDAGEITVTIDGQMLGTPAYMSPEHARGEAHQADRRSDVYSLGVVLFQLLTGELPFRGHARMLMMQILRDEPPKPRTLRAGVPRDLQTICLKCLEKLPSKRYATAGELADELRRYLRGEPILARPITGAGRLYRWCRRQPTVAALAGMLLVALAAGVWGVSWYAVRAAEGRANLYHRMVRQVQAERTQMKEGYVSRVWNDLATARWIDTPEMDVDLLRQEAVASLGDFRGHDPVTIESKDRTITVCSLHPHGKLLAIGHQDGRIELHDAKTGTAIGKISGQVKPMAALSFTNDGGRLLSVDTSGKVHETVFGSSLAMSKSLQSVEIFQVDGGYELFEFVSGGRNLVAYDAKSASLWDLETRSAIRPPVEAPEDRRLRFVQLSPDGKWLAASANTPTESASDRLLLWNVATGEMEKDVLLDRGQGYRRSMAFSNDSRLIAFGGEGMALYEVPELSRYSFYPGDAIKALAFSPNDQLLSLVQIRGTVALWSMTANTKATSLSHPRAPNAAVGGESTAFSADGRLLVSVKSDSARVWDFHSASERLVLPGHRGGVPTLAFSGKEPRLVSGGGDATVRTWSLSDGTLAFAPLSFGGKVQSVALSPNGHWLATVDWSPQSEGQSQVGLNVSAARDSSHPMAIPHHLGRRVNAVAFSPNGQYLAACGDGLQVWRVENPDAADGSIQLTDVAHLPGTRSLFLRFSPDSNLLAWADNWRNARVWDVAAGEELSFSATMHIGWHGLAFVEGGLAFVGPDYSLEVWDIRGGRRNFSLGGPSEFSSPHIAATADGAYLAGAHTSETVALWDVRARKRLFLFRPERNEIWSLSFNPAGSKLAVGLSDGGVAVWDLAAMNRALGKLDLAWMTGDEKVN